MSALSDRIATVYREESGRVLARLIRVLGGDFQLAEEGLHDAFEAALTQWGEGGVPAEPAGHSESSMRVSRCFMPCHALVTKKNVHHA